MKVIAILIVRAYCGKSYNYKVPTHPVMHLYSLHIYISDLASNTHIAGSGISIYSNGILQTELTKLILQEAVRWVHIFHC